MPPYVTLVVLASAGFFLSFYIFERKSSGNPLVCPIGAECDEVVHSPYARFLGMRNEMVGIVYYLSIAVGYGVLLSFPYSGFTLLNFLLLCISAVAALFSLYLVFVQAAIIKHWCSWCLISAVVSVGIFFVSAANLPMSFV